MVLGIQREFSLGTSLWKLRTKSLSSLTLLLVERLAECVFLKIFESADFNGEIQAM